MNFENLLESSTSFATLLFLPTESLFSLDFVLKLRHSASAYRSLFVDADIPVSVLRATETVLDFAIRCLSDSTASQAEFWVEDSKL